MIDEISCATCRLLDKLTDVNIEQDKILSEKLKSISTKHNTIFNDVHCFLFGPQGFSNKNSKCSKWVFDEFAVETAINCYPEYKKQSIEHILA